MQNNTLRQIRAELDFSKRELLWLMQIVLDVALGAAIAFALHSRTGWGLLIAAILSPVLFFNSFALMHEAVHRALSDRLWLNDLVGVIGGAFCFLPYEPWRQMHLEHHLWAGNVERDPVNKLRKDYDPSQRRKNLILSSIWRSWLPILALLQHIVFWTYLFQYFKKKALHRGRGVVFIASYLVPAIIYAGVAYFGSRYLPLVALLPGIFLYLVLVEFVNLPHHLDLPTTRGETKLALLDQYLIARSAIYPRWFSRWVLLNFNLHLEHHLFPNLPWHGLEKARILVKPILEGKYNETFGSQWLLEHRNQPLGKLLAPSDMKDETSEKKVA